MNEKIRFAALVSLLVLLPGALAAQQHLGFLQGSLFIANDAFGGQQTLGRYQTYHVISGGFQGRLDWRGFGPWREYDITDHKGARTGTLEYFGWRFTLYDAARKPVAYIEGPQGFLGRYWIFDTKGEQVGSLDSPFGDGASFNVRGDQRTIAVFARVGLKLQAGRPERETAQASRFGVLHRF